VDRNAVARFNTQRVTPKSHAFIPREKGGDFGRCCIFHADHDVHSTAPASNVLMFGGGRRAKK